MASFRPVVSLQDQRSTSSRVSKINLWKLKNGWYQIWEKQSSWSFLNTARQRPLIPAEPNLLVFLCKRNEGILGVCLASQKVIMFSKCLPLATCIRKVWILRIFYGILCNQILFWSVWIVHVKKMVKDKWLRFKQSFFEATEQITIFRSSGLSFPSSWETDFQLNSPWPRKNLWVSSSLQI